MKPTSKRIEYLDGLRGVAAGLVVIHHLMIGFFPASYMNDPEVVHTGLGLELWLHNTPLGIWINGGLAVAIFLVLSGYVVGIAADRKPSAPGFLKGVLKRFLRFFLPILATNLVAFGLISLNWHWNKPAGELSGSWWWLATQWQINPSLVEAIKQAYMSLVTMFDLRLVYNSSTWTMPFFFLGPIGLMLLSVLVKRQKFRNIVLVLLMTMYLKTHYWPIILGYFLGKYSGRIIVRGWILKLVLLTVVVVLGNYPQAYNTATGGYGMLPVFTFVHTSTFYHTAATTALLILAISSIKLQTMLSARLFMFLGKISFSMYLFHILVINSVSSGVFLAAIKVMPYTAAFGVSLLLSIPVIVGGSVLIYRLVEKPAVSLKTMLQ